ncbi:hypothetical protein AGMMS50230_20670 [Spirochaetia bacterium]|nr:hypothetical protein AGMMS50230_20670 [Spirochaetia bacterium]
MGDSKEILTAMISVLHEEQFNVGKPPQPEQMYIPPAHIKALQLYSNLIVGARGVGKSTWTSALSDINLQKIIGANIKELKNVIVRLGFSEKSDNTLYPSKDIFSKLLGENFSPYEIWKTVVVRWLSDNRSDDIPIESWGESVKWTKNNPEPWVKILEKANKNYYERNTSGLILFDALDRSSDNWEKMDEIVRDLLRLVMQLKTFSNIHAKIFLREDQFSRNVTNFPDASKLLSTKTELDWDLHDLHGLLWQLLCNAQGDGGNALRIMYKEAIGIDLIPQNNYWVINNEVKREEAKQRALFEKLAGPWMGRDPRRGVPYIWSVSHLADGKKLTSPRSFLTAIRDAAEDSLNRTSEYPLHYESIKRAVRRASSIRIDEIAEDYPWVKDICQLITGNNVPIEFSKVEEVWKQKYPNGPATMNPDRRLPPQDLDKGWFGIQKELVRLGVFEEIRDGRINMPDLYRLGFGLGRKGGIPPINKGLN